MERMETHRDRHVEREIQFFDYPALFTCREDAFLETIRQVLAGGRFILQEELERFESHLAEYLDVRYVFGVGNGTDALTIALRACGVREGDEVILPAHTFVATAAAVHHAGARPVLVDVCEDHLIDPARVEAAITADTRAIMPVQLNGRTCDMKVLQCLADAHGLLIIEDAAQALGSEYGGRKAGTFGRAAGFSFYPAKLLGCFGDGGAIATDRHDVAEKIRRLRDHGRTNNGDVLAWSYNSRLDNVQAALLDIKLESFEWDVERRRELAAMYDGRLSRYPELRLPPSPSGDPARRDVYQNYELECKRRDELRQHLTDQGIGTIIQWGGRAVHQFSGLGLDGISLPVTERIMNNSFLLPLHPHLSDEQVGYICDVIDDFFSS